MTVAELKNVIDRSLSMKLNKKNDPVLITTRELTPSVGGRASAEVKFASSGFDWESGQFRLEPAVTLCELHDRYTHAARMHIHLYRYPTKLEFTCTCPRCEKMVDKQDRFCRQCGQALYYKEDKPDVVWEML